MESRFGGWKERLRQLSEKKGSINQEDFILEIEHFTQELTAYIDEQESKYKLPNKDSSRKMPEPEGDAAAEWDRYRQIVTDLNKSQSIAKIGNWKWYVREGRVEWSDEMFRIFGVDRESFTGNLEAIMQNCIHPEDRASVEEINRIIAETGRKITIEYRIVLPDGTIKYIWAESGENTRDKNNQVIFSSGIVQDITARKLEAIKLNQLSEKLREQADVMEYAHVLIRNMDNQIVYWNKGMEKLYGWSKEEAMGKATHKFFQTIFPEGLAAYQQTILDKGVWEGELVHTTKAGHRIVVASHHTLHLDSCGQPYLILEVNNDITQLKQAEERLKESEQDLLLKNQEYVALNEEYAAINEEYVTTNEELRQVNEELLESKNIIVDERDLYLQTSIDLNKSQSIAKIGVWKWNLKEDLLEWTDEMFHIFEIDRQTFTGNLADVMQNRIHPDDRARMDEVNQRIAETGESIGVECRLLLPNGTVKYIWAESGDAIRDKNNNLLGTAGIVQDITERKKTEEKLREQAEVLEHAHVLIRNLDNCIVYWNKGMEKLYGWTKEEAMGKITHRFFQTTFPVIFENYQQQLLEKGVWEGELIHTTKSGNKIVVASHHTIYRDAKGAPFLILEVNNDITELKQAEEKLRESERNLIIKNQEYAALNEEYAAINEEYLTTNEDLRLVNEELIEAKEDIEKAFEKLKLINAELQKAQQLAKIGSWTWDLQKNRLEWSDEMFEIFELKKEEFMGDLADVMVTCIHPDDRSKVEEANRSVLEHGIPVPLEYRLLLLNGINKTVWAEAGELQKDENDKPAMLSGIVQDITDRKIAEEKIKTSERNLRLFVEYSPAAIAMFDTQMRYIAASKRFLADYNIGDADVIGKSHYEIFPEIGDEWKQIHRRCLAGATEKRDEDPFPRLDGTLDWVHWEIHPWYESQHKIGGILLFSEVITERKNAEIALKNSEERYKSLVDNFPDGTVTLYDRDLRLRFVAGTELKKSNQAPEDYLGKSFRELTPEEAYLEVIPVLNAAFRGQTGHYEMQYPNHRFYQVSVAPLHKADGTIDEILVISQNISERKLAEEKARERETQFKLLFENAPEPMFIQLHSRFAYVNKAMVDLYKASSIDELIGSPILDRIHPDYRDEVANRVKQLNEKKMRVLTNEIMHIRLDNTPIDVESTAVPVKFNNEDGALVFVKDITERKRAEEKLKESEVRFSTIFHSSPVGAVLTHLATGIITDVNEAYLNLIGYQRDQLINHTSKELNIYINPAHRDDIFNHLGKKGKLHDTEITLRKNNGETRIALVSAEVVYLSGDAYVVSMLSDITDRKKAEMDLKNSEEKFRSLFETIQLGILFQDEKGNVLLINQAAEKILGGTRDEINQHQKIHGRPKAYKEDGTLYTEQELPASISSQSGKPETNCIMKIHRLKSNETLWISNSAIPLKDQDSGKMYVYTIIEDITQRVRFTLESRKLRTAFSQSSSSFLITNEEGLIEDINKQTEIISGYTRQEIICQTPALFKSGIHDKAFYQTLWETIKSGNTWEGQLCNRHKDGHLYWIHAIISPIKNEKGIITHYFATCNDITQQKKDREELNKYREHLENLVDERTQEVKKVSSKLLNLVYSMPLGYVETDLEGTITAFNSDAESIFGCSSKKVVGQPIHSIVNFTPEILETLQSSGDKVNVFEHDHHVQGNTINCRWNVVRLTYNNDSLIGTAYIIEDISKMKRAEQSLHMALEKERELNELKSGFVSMTSHQFRTPLTTILSNTEMLDELIEGLKEDAMKKGKRFVRRIYNNVERLELLMSDVLLLGKHEAGKINFRPQIIKLSTFIKSLVTDTKFPHQNNREPLLTITGPEKDLRADPQLLAHIIHNLLSNAFKYSKDIVKLNIEYLQDIVRISIVDHGIGIPLEDQSKLFSSFFRASNTENLMGTGLGLVIVKEYVEMHQGSISFKSEINNGSEFTIELPYGQVEDEKAVG